MVACDENGYTLHLGDVSFVSFHERKPKTHITHENWWCSRLFLATVWDLYKFLQLDKTNDTVTTMQILADVLV